MSINSLKATLERHKHRAVLCDSSMSYSNSINVEYITKFRRWRVDLFLLKEYETNFVVYINGKAMNMRTHSKVRGWETQKEY